MWLTGLVAPRHVGSSQTRARTRVPCIGRQILNHCATREAPVLVNFLHCNLTPFPSFHTVVFGSHHAQPVHKEWGVTFYLLEYGISTLGYSCIHICLFAIYLLNNLFIAVWTHKYLYFIIQYYFILSFWFFLIFILYRSIVD